MIEFFNTISGYIDKITQFFQVVLDKIQSAWESIMIFSSFFPPVLAGTIITIVVLAIVFRILGR